MKDELGSRMKENYENRSKTKLLRRTPVVIRLDGRAFHTFTKGFDRPFDQTLIKAMQMTTKDLVKNIQGCKLGYTQSDEISLLLTDYDKLDTQAWFDYNLQKIISISSSMATLYFNRNLRALGVDESKLDLAMFDSRAFNIPKEEVCNYFIWRQQDCSKNSITMLAQSKFSHKELQGKNGSVKQDMLIEKFGINWNDCSVPEKRGTCVKNGDIDLNIPIFTKDRCYVEELI